MDTIKDEYSCTICGQTFNSKYDYGGAIDHSNYSFNNDVFVSRWEGGWDKHDLFLDSITLDGNFCNIKNHTIEVGMQVFECRLKWLKEKGYSEIAKWLESKRVDIPAEFDKLKRVRKDEIRSEIQNQLANIEYLKEKLSEDG